MKGDFSRETFDASQRSSAVLMQQGRVQLDADWNEQQAITRHRIATGAADIIGQSGAPFNHAGFAIGLADGELTIGAGRYYVDGILCECEPGDSLLHYAEQPDLPNAPDLLAVLNTPNTTAAIVYLHVFERHETWIDNPQIREVALGGADTTSRLRTVWQVQLLPVSAPDGPPDGNQSFDEWDALVGQPDGMLAVRTDAAETSGDPCLLAPQAGYQPLENQLYRVEIHEGGDLNTASFKWSRDNGAIVAAIVQAVDGDTVTVHDLGPDDVLGFAIGQWVEIIDDGSELNGRPGEIARITGIDMATGRITLSMTPADVDMQRHPKLRRWDGFGRIQATASAPNNDEAPDGGWIPAEDTIEFLFTRGSYRTGDYWTIPARTATPAIEWPEPQLPHGITHHYARLALVWLDPTLDKTQPPRIADCRRIFTPLAETPPAIHITGISWENDAKLLDDLAKGLTVWLDAPPDPASINPPLNPGSMIVTLEVTMPAMAALPAFKIGAILDGMVSMLSPQELQWKPTPPALELVNKTKANTPAMRLRVQLKGHTIWSTAPAAPGEQAARRYLDGQAFGIPVDQNGPVPEHIGLSFPSGAGARASDFESWLYLTDAPAPPLRAATARFFSTLLGDKEQDSRGKTISLPPATSPSFYSDEKINSIFITFSRPIRANTAAGSFSIRTFSRANPTTGTEFDIKVVQSNEGIQVTLTSRTPLPTQLFFPAGTYLLTIKGDISPADNGAPLGSDLRVPFVVKDRPKQPVRGKPPISFD